MRRLCDVWNALTRALARRGAVAPAALAVLAATLALSSSPQALACGGVPPRPFCSKTVSLSQALPGSVVLTGGGTLTVPTEAFVQAINFGGPICPPAPYTIKVVVTISCPITGVSMGMTTVAGGNGYTPVPVPVVIPAGPPRVCTLSAMVTVTFADGTAITTTAADKDVCIAEPAPGNPTLPRIDIQHMGPAIVHVHPGDQGALRYRIRNNDPTLPFSGMLTADSEGSTRLVTSAGIPELPGNGPFTISDPTAGDNFPLRFGPIPPPACVPLPPNPADPIIPVETMPLVIPPGQARDVVLYLRPWGMCANGSCSKSRIRFEGFFQGGAPGLACTSGVVVADTAVPPVFLWLDGGRVPEPFLFPPFCVFPHNPHPDLSINVDTRVLQAGGTRNGQPFTLNFQPNAQHGFGRFQAQSNFPPTVESFFDIFTDLEFNTTPGNTFQLQGLGLAPGAPHGFEQFFPMAMGTARVRGPATGGAPRVVDSFFDVFFQVSIDGIDQMGNRHQLQVINPQFMPTPIPTRARIQLQATRPPTDGAPVPLVGMSIRIDERGFSRPGNFLFCPGDTNGDALVTFPDLNQVLSQFGQAGAGLAGDIDADGDVDFQDLNYVLSNFGRNCGPLTT